MRRMYYSMVAGIALLTGCAATPPAGENGVASSQPASQPAGPISLRTAMLPNEEPQSFRIQLHEKRETTPPGSTPVVHELMVDLSGTLTKSHGEDSHKEGRQNKDIHAVLIFDRILVSYEASQPPLNLHYDSESDTSGQGNALADMMTHMQGAKLAVTLSQTGRVRDIDGLDAIWREANILAAPPPLFPVQWTFRDITMTELLAEALFPPMPGAAVGLGDRYETDIPANIPLLARFNSHLRGRVVLLEFSEQDSTLAHLEVMGEIGDAAPILAGEVPAIRPTIRTATHTIIQTVDPQTHSLEQNCVREMEIGLKMQPPAGESDLELTLIQKRTLTSQRGYIPSSSTQPK